jgi:hypothetical protein
LVVVLITLFSINRSSSNNNSSSIKNGSINCSNRILMWVGGRPLHWKDQYKVVGEYSDHREKDENQ